MTDEEVDGEQPRRATKLAKQVTASSAKAAVSGAVAGAAAGGPEGAVIGAGLAALGAGAGELVKAGIESFEGATARLEKAAEAEKARALEEAEEELRERVEVLLAKVGNVESVASDFRATLHAWSRAWDRTGDAKKRRVIMAALLRAFDAEAYETGLTLRLFAILEELDYPELRFLATEFGPSGLQQWTRAKAEFEERQRAAKPRTLPKSHVVNLVQGWMAAGSKPLEMLERLAAHRLVTRSPTNVNGDFINSQVTWLGRQLLDLCGDTDRLGRLWPDREEPTA